MQVKWTSHLKTNEDKYDFGKIVKSQLNGIVFERLRQIVLEKIESYDKPIKQEQDYDSASWAYKQAHRNGATSALNEILNMIAKD